jgi:hypothetical protein
MLNRHQPNDYQVVPFGPFRESLQSSRVPLLVLVSGDKDCVPLARVLGHPLFQLFLGTGVI